MDARKFLLKFAVWAAVGILTFLGLHFLLPCLLPFLLGGGIALLLRPAAASLRQVTHMSWKPSAVAAAFLFYGVAGALLWGTGSALVTQTAALCRRLPHFCQTVLEPAALDLGVRASALLAELSPAASRQAGQAAAWLGESIRNGLTTVSARLLSAAADFAAALPSLALACSFAVLSSFLILMDYDAIAGFIRRQLPPALARPARDSTRFLLSTGRKVLKAYFLLMLITFLEVAAGLWLLRVEYFVVIGLVVAVLDALPVLGSGCILVPWGIWLLLQGNHPLGAGILILFGVITAARSVLEPKLVGDRIGLHPLATLLAMYTGMKLAGFWGFLLAPLLVTLLVYLNGKGHFRFLR